MAFTNGFSTKRSTYKKARFLELNLGQTIIRVLDESPVVHKTHFVRNITIKCIGEDCPICQKNAMLRATHGKDAWKAEGFIPLREVGYLNVLDRTPAKVCPNDECKHGIKPANFVYPPACPKCGTSILNVKEAPLNHVVILAKGKEIFEALETFDSAIRDSSGNPLGIRNFDIAFFTIESGKRKQSSPSPMPERNDKVEVNPDELHDLHDAVITLQREEINDLLRGVSLRDIFAARRAKEEAQTPKQEDESKDSLQEAIDEMPF